VEKCRVEVGAVTEIAQQIRDGVASGMFEQLVDDQPLVAYASSASPRTATLRTSACVNSCPSTRSSSLGVFNAPRIIGTRIVPL
jgi:hypothetical protein